MKRFFRLYKNDMLLLLVFGLGVFAICWADDAMGALPGAIIAFAALMKYINLWKKRKAAVAELRARQEAGETLEEILAADAAEAEAKKAAEEAKKAAAEAAAAEEAAALSLAAERREQFSAWMKEHTARRAFRIDCEKTQGLPLASSKFGGVPYWDGRQDYPATELGEKLCLLAQIDLADLPERDELLPETGLLQFFIAPADDYGLEFSDRTDNNSFRVVYHGSVDPAVTEADVLALDIPVSTRLAEAGQPFPLYGEYSLRFVPFTDAMGESVTGFDVASDEAWQALYGESLGDDDVSSYLGEDEYELLLKALDNGGCKILGYPAFTQWDPRYLPDNEQGSPLTTDRYDTLLLQIDSVKGIMWGDSGIGNFFINSEKLKALDFSDVLYSWDCY